MKQHKQESISGTKVLSVRLPEDTIDRLRKLTKEINEIVKKKYWGHRKQKVYLIDVVEQALNRYMDNDPEAIVKDIKKGE